MKGGVKDVRFLQAVQLSLAVAHLIIDTLQFIVQLQLLPFKLAVLLLIPGRDMDRNLQSGRNLRLSEISQRTVRFVTLFVGVLV